MPYFKWEPLKDLEQFFEEGMSSFPRLGGDLAANIYEEGDNVIAKVNIPGIDPEKVDVSVENDVLRITGSREEEKEVKDKKFYSKEIKQGSFERVLRLPVQVQHDKTDAEYKDGVLTVTMPKKEKTSSGKINIKIKGDHK